MIKKAAQSPITSPVTGPTTDPAQEGACVPRSPAGQTPPQEMSAAQLVQAVHRLGSWVGASVQQHGLFISTIVHQLAQSWLTGNATLGAGFGGHCVPSALLLLRWKPLAPLPLQFALHLTRARLSTWEGHSHCTATWCRAMQSSCYPINGTSPEGGHHCHPHFSEKPRVSLCPTGSESSHDQQTLERPLGSCLSNEHRAVWPRTGHLLLNFLSYPSLNLHRLIHQLQTDSSAWSRVKNSRFWSQLGPGDNSVSDRHKKHLVSGFWVHVQKGR